MIIDTNILVYAINTRSPKHKKAQKFLEDNLGNSEIAHQNILEAIRVLTHSKYSHPMKLPAALEAIANISDPNQLISPNQTTILLTLDFIKFNKLSGNRIFDAYLAATALSNGITTLATDNTKDFKKFTQLSVNNPFN